MKVCEFYKDGKKVFTEEILQKFSFIDDVKRECALLNHMFSDHFDRCEITTPTTLKASTSAEFVLMQNEKMLQAVYDALNIDFDPLLTSRMKDIDEKTGKDTDKTTFNSTIENDNTTTSNPGSIIEQSSRSYDENELKVVEKSEQSGEDSTVVDAEQKHTGDDTTEHTFGSKNTRTTEGFSGIDYEKNIAALYKSKEVNLFDKICNLVADCILIPIFSFDD